MRRYAVIPVTITIRTIRML